MAETQYILSLSYGKDSLACLGAIEKMGMPLHRIVHAEVWATDDIPADLPPMVEFKKKADKIIKERWGIEVEHIYATRKCSQPVNVERERERERRNSHTKGNSTLLGNKQMVDSASMDFLVCEERGVHQGSKPIYSMQLEKQTYEKIFYRTFTKGIRKGNIYGFAVRHLPYCTGELKQRPLEMFRSNFLIAPLNKAQAQILFSTLV